MRSFGPAVHMRHSGGVNIGSQATPASILHLRGNLSYHGSLTVDQESNDAPAPAARQQARLYVKNGKLVIQWNDGGKTLLTTIPLEPVRALPCDRAHHDRHDTAVTEQQPVTAVPDTFTLELTLEEMGFLRLLLTNATVQPAQLKKLCGEVQAKTGAHRAPPPG